MKNMMGDAAPPPAAQETQESPTPAGQNEGDAPEPEDFYKTFTESNTEAGSNALVFSFGQGVAKRKGKSIMFYFLLLW